MSVKDFYNALTPGCYFTHGVGLGTYKTIKKDEACSLKIYESEKLPAERREGEPSLLNEVIILIHILYKYITAMI